MNFNSSPMTHDHHAVAFQNNQIKKPRFTESELLERIEHLTETRKNLTVLNAELEAKVVKLTKSVENLPMYTRAYFDPVLFNIALKKNWVSFRNKSNFQQAEEYGTAEFENRATTEYMSDQATINQFNIPYEAVSCQNSENQNQNWEFQNQHSGYQQNLQQFQHFENVEQPEFQYVQYPHADQNLQSGFANQQTFQPHQQKYLVDPMYYTRLPQFVLPQSLASNPSLDASQPLTSLMMPYQPSQDNTQTTEFQQLPLPSQQPQELLSTSKPSPQQETDQISEPEPDRCEQLSESKEPEDEKKKKRINMFIEENKKLVHICFQQQEMIFKQQRKFHQQNLTIQMLLAKNHSANVENQNDVDTQTDETDLNRSESSDNFLMVDSLDDGVEANEEERNYFNDKQTEEKSQLINLDNSWKTDPVENSEIIGVSVTVTTNELLKTAENTKWDKVSSEVLNNENEEEKEKISEEYKIEEINKEVKKVLKPTENDNEICLSEKNDEQIYETPKQVKDKKVDDGGKEVIEEDEWIVVTKGSRRIIENSPACSINSSNIVLNSNLLQLSKNPIEPVPLKESVTNHKDFELSSNETTENIKKLSKKEKKKLAAKRKMEEKEKLKAKEKEDYDLLNQAIEEKKLAEENVRLEKMEKVQEFLLEIGELDTEEKLKESIAVYQNYMESRYLSVEDKLDRKLKIAKTVVTLGTRAVKTIFCLSKNPILKSKEEEILNLVVLGTTNGSEESERKLQKLDAKLNSVINQTNVTELDRINYAISYVSSRLETAEEETESFKMTYRIINKNVLEMLKVFKISQGLFCVQPLSLSQFERDVEADTFFADFSL